MSLRDLLYLCAYCGADTGLVRETVHCTSCGRTYEQEAEADRVRVTDLQGAKTTIGHDELVDRIASATEDSTTLSTPAAARFSNVEHQVHYLGELIGFFEESGPSLPGRLVLEDARLRFEAPEGEVHEWALRDLRAVQTASGAIQVSSREGVLVSFRILSDSPRRWEQALKERLRRVWRGEDRGEIIEFQPRIRSK